MSRQPVSLQGRDDAAGLRLELLDRLGLRASASDQDVESAHNGLVEFLELAPHEVRFWAAARTTDVDEAFALLSGPEEDLIATPRTVTGTDGGAGEASRSASSAPPPYAPSAAPSSPAGRTATLIGGQRRTPTVLASLILIAGVVFGVYYMGKADDLPGISGTPTAQATPTSGPTAVPVDKVKVGELMKKISANPKDVASLQALGDIYFASSDYKNVSLWEQKVLDVDPKNQVALIALGAAQFNQGNAAEAKKQWLKAAAIYPNVAEVHYDLGFLYLSQTPPDKANMTIEWNKVIAIDPTSDIAKTVATHLKSSQTPAPTASATSAK